MTHGSTSRRIFARLTCLVLAAAVLAAPFAAHGQTRRAAARTQEGAGTRKPVCNGGWSGVVTFTKYLQDAHESDEPGIRKEKDRIRHRTSRDYKYTARAVVDGSEPGMPKVSTTVDLTDKNLNWGEERVWDSCNSRENGHWFIIEGTDNRETRAQASGPADSFHLQVDEMNGTYSFNLAFPDAAGTYKREEDVKKSGHCQARNNEPYKNSENQPTRIDGESFSIYGEKLDPKNPDTITGSKVWGYDPQSKVKTFIHKATWRFTRCPQKLLITDLTFEHPKFPNWNDWREIEELLGTIDGNPVRIKSKILNLSSEAKFVEVTFKETYEGDKYNGSRPDLPLKDSIINIRLEAGEEREVEIIWDSSGYAWFDDGRPRDLQRIKTEVWENNQLKDKLTKNLYIAPKPLVLVHGLWSDASVWLPTYPNLMTYTHSYRWKAYPVGQYPEHGRLETGGKVLSSAPTADMNANADQLARYVRHAQEDSNAWHVDMVAHSSGGLIARLYIQKSMEMMPDGEPLVKHLVMLGTPNLGAPCANVLDLKFGLFGQNVQAVRELRPADVAVFNRNVRERKGVRFSALAGNTVPVICGGYAWNDGFVTVDSATHGVEDFAYSNDLHHELTYDRSFGKFVRPHLVTGPKGTYPIPVRSDPTGIDKYKLNGALRDPSAADLIRVGYDPRGYAETPPADDPQNFAKEVRVPAGQTVEVELPVAAAANLGVTFLAGESISVSLVDGRGAVVASNASGSPLAGTVFRSLFYNKPVADGTWKLRIANGSDSELSFLGFSWSAAPAAVRAVPSAG